MPPGIIGAFALFAHVMQPVFAAGFPMERDARLGQLAHVAEPGGRQRCLRQGHRHREPLGLEALCVGALLAGALEPVQIAFAHLECLCRQQFAAPACRERRTLSAVCR